MKRLSLLLILTLFITKSFAVVTIDITRGNLEPLPTAISNFYIDNPERFSENIKKLNLDKNLPKVIKSNLTRSGLFYVLDNKSYIQKPKLSHLKPRFEDWKLIKAQIMISGKLKIDDKGRLRVEFRLWDVVSAKEIEGLALFATPSSWRRIAHIISDKIYQRLTGEEGYFDTRIVYISESGPLNARVKRLAIMDQDGHNHQYLTDGSYLVLTPRFSPNSQEVAYLAYYQKEPRVYVLNLETNRQELLGTFPGMTFAPRFSPDGKSIIMSLADGGLTDIFIMNLLTQEVMQLTNSPSIDTSPTFSPDGQKIVFNSDRGGSQQLYVMNLDGSKQKRISFKKGRYATPVWSPRGDLIAFTKMYEGQFYIGVMRPDGSGERLIAKGYLVEAPTWAPNGRVLIYFKQEKSDTEGKGGKVRLFRVDITGYNEREIITPSDASDPAWSPLIP